MVRAIDAEMPRRHGAATWISARTAGAPFIGAIATSAVKGCGNNKVGTISHARSPNHLPHRIL